MTPGADALQLSPELREADPADLLRMGHRQQADAAELSAAAIRLRALARGLVPVAWCGRGASSFEAAALGQAARWDALADGTAALGAVLCRLAAVLGDARAQAEAAVRAAHAGGDPAPLLRRLTEAEEQARSAWAAAHSAFEDVAARLPASANPVAAPPVVTWTPAGHLQAATEQQWRASAGSAPSCVDGGYAGGGMLVGPDGRPYPLVVPWLAADGPDWTGDVATSGSDGRSVAALDGFDPGWRTIAALSGVDDFGTAATTADKAAVITAGLAGGSLQTVGSFRPEQLARLSLSETGYPALAPASTLPTPRRVAGFVQIPRSALVRGPDGALRWVPDTSRDAQLPAEAKVVPTGPNLVALVGGGLAAAGTAAKLDDDRAALYRAVFEENADGRRRARLNLYAVVGDGTGLSVLASAAWLRPDGSLQRRLIRFRPPNRPVLKNAQQGWRVAEPTR